MDEDLGDHDVFGEGFGMGVARSRVGRGDQGGLKHVRGGGEEGLACICDCVHFEQLYLLASGVEGVRCKMMGVVGSKKGGLNEVEALFELSSQGPPSAAAAVFSPHRPCAFFLDRNSSISTSSNTSLDEQQRKASSLLACASRPSLGDHGKRKPG